MLTFFEKNNGNKINGISNNKTERINGLTNSSTTSAINFAKILTNETHKNFTYEYDGNTNIVDDETKIKLLNYCKQLQVDNFDIIKLENFIISDNDNEESISVDFYIQKNNNTFNIQGPIKNNNKLKNKRIEGNMNKINISTNLSYKYEGSIHYVDNATMNELHEFSKTINGHKNTKSKIFKITHNGNIIDVIFIIENNNNVISFQGPFVVPNISAIISSKDIISSHSLGSINIVKSKIQKNSTLNKNHN